MVYGAVGEPFIESLHDEQGGNVSAYTILKGDVPGEVFQVYLCDGCLSLDAHVGLGEYLAVGDEVAHALADLIHLGFFKFQALEGVTCVSQYEDERHLLWRK